MNERPNLFEIATSELSQDAFIVWLCQWADTKYKKADINLHKLGQDFVKYLIKKQYPQFDEEIQMVKAGRQWENIDIWIEVNSNTNSKYFIIIEDKTYTGEHSSQLERYKEIASNYCKNNGFNIPVCIYLKTGNDCISNINTVTEKGYFSINRQDLLGILKEELSSNDIYSDFINRLNRIEKENNEWKNKLIKDWKVNDWQGFYQYLDKTISLNWWGYVPNPNGGFFNACLNYESLFDFPFYIQIEQDKLCFKISTHIDEIHGTSAEQIFENVSRSSIRDKFHFLLMQEAELQSIKNIKRPQRFGCGNYMTIAIIDREDWLGKDNTIVDTKSIIDRMISYKFFIERIIDKHSKGSLLNL